MRQQSTQSVVDARIAFARRERARVHGMRRPDCVAVGAMCGTTKLEHAASDTSCRCAARCALLAVHASVGENAHLLSFASINECLPLLHRNRRTHFHIYLANDK